MTTGWISEIGFYENSEFNQSNQSINNPDVERALLQLLILFTHCYISSSQRSVVLDTYHVDHSCQKFEISTSSVRVLHTHMEVLLTNIGKSYYSTTTKRNLFLRFFVWSVQSLEDELIQIVGRAMKLCTRYVYTRRLKRSRCSSWTVHSGSRTGFLGYFSYESSYIYGISYDTFEIWNVT